jgi:predicted nucleotidyltransferase
MESINHIESVVREITGRIILVAQPLKVYLFGSAVKNTFHENSDLDFLVVVPNGINKRQTTMSIYKQLLEIGFASDIVVVTVDDFDNYKDDSSYIIKTAIAEGRLVYG